MAIILKGSARVKVPPEHRDEVLGMYLHQHKDTGFIRNYKYADGYAYLPLNADKLSRVASILNETIDDQRSVGVLVVPLLILLSVQKNPGGKINGNNQSF